MAKATWNGTVIAQSEATVLVEGTHYFPADSIRSDYFKDSDTTSVCNWKGTASYYTVEVGGETNADCAWYYPEPLEKAESIRGHVAFWKGVEVE
jgi:uncharacterized protein (DUF427 family)